MTNREPSLAPSFQAAALIGLAVMGIGGALTDAGGWYGGLAKPDWQPPQWLFGPVWLTIVLMAAWAAALSWRSAGEGRVTRTLVVGLFAYNAALSVLWNVFFFRLQRPDWALGEMAFLWMSILLLIVMLWPVSRSASLLLSPYLAWVTFAALVNLAIVDLNGPFGDAA